MKKKVLSILVDNTSGVLSRISGLFSRRGYNIDSLTVGETENPKYSRMTVVVRGDDHILDQIEKQLAKLEDVRCVKELKSGHSVCRELVLITVGVQASNRPEITLCPPGACPPERITPTFIAGSLTASPASNLINGIPYVLGNNFLIAS